MARLTAHATEWIAQRGIKEEDVERAARNGRRHKDTRVSWVIIIEWGKIGLALDTRSDLVITV